MQMMRGTRGLNVCKLAEDDCNLPAKFIYQCLKVYIFELVIPRIYRGQNSIIPALGMLRVVRNKATNRYNCVSRKVERLPARKTVAFRTSKLVFDIINNIDSKKKRVKQFIHLSDIEYIAAEIKSNMHSVNLALRSWMDAALLFISQYGKVHLPAFGFLRVGKLNEARWARDIHNGRNIVTPECYRLKLVMRREVGLMIKNVLN